jgi:nucleoside-diphosphate-sugar epimerase
MHNKLFIIGKRSNLSQHLCANKNNVSLISGSSLNQLSYEISQVEKCDIIYNLFYPATLLKDINNPKDFVKYTLQMLGEFISICKKNKNIKTLIYSSSSAIYGNTSSSSVICENTKELSLVSGLSYPITLNGVIKLSSEVFLRENLKDSGVNLIIARIFNMYGGNDQFSVISKIINAIENNKDFTLYNYGKEIRDFIHVEDVVAIYLKLINSKYQGIVNIGTGKGTKIISLVEKFELLYNKSLIKKNITVNNSVLHSVASMNKLFEIIGDYKFKNLSDYLANVVKKN